MTPTVVESRLTHTLMRRAADIFKWVVASRERVLFPVASVANVGWDGSG